MRLFLLSNSAMRLFLTCLSFTHLLFHHVLQIIGIAICHTINIFYVMWKVQISVTKLKTLSTVYFKFIASIYPTPVQKNRLKVDLWCYLIKAENCSVLIHVFNSITMFLISVVYATCNTSFLLFSTKRFKFVIEKKV